MSPFSREEVKFAIDRFTEANVKAEGDRNWAPLADFYTDDATYTYVGLAAGGLVEAHGKEEIRKIVMGRDMEDYAGWTFPFEWVAIDGDRVITRWWNRAPGTRGDGSFLQCPGLSVLEYAGGGKFRSQFDIYDRLSVQEVKDEGEKLAKKAKRARAKSEKKAQKEAKKEEKKAKVAAKKQAKQAKEAAKAAAKQAKPPKSSKEPKPAKEPKPPKATKPPKPPKAKKKDDGKKAKEQ